MSNSRFKSVDDYIAQASPEAAAILEGLRSLIKSVVPDVQEKIAWNVPYFTAQHDIGGISAFPKHVTFGSATPLTDEIRFQLEEKGYKTGTHTIRITFEQEVPINEIETILKTNSQ